MTRWTHVGTALRDARHALVDRGEAGRLEAQLLVAGAAGRSRSWVLAHPEAPLHPLQSGTLETWLVRFTSGQPLPYLLGEWEFFGRRFEVNAAVLIPRPESEMLVEAGLSFLRRRGGPARVLDVGTGSGCLAVSLAAEYEAAQVVASDLSWAALCVARRNTIAHGLLARVDFLQADLLPPIAGSVDLLVANLPYVPSRRVERLQVAQSARSARSELREGREPRLALDGGHDGLDLIRRMLPSIPRSLSEGGRALLEIDSSQAQPVLALIRRSLPTWNAAIARDLAGRDRLLVLDRLD
ncbi:MAG: peptide chain release factor N(5)-glutamine methyltransferase [Anaerolineales bacterium]